MRSLFLIISLVLTSGVFASLEIEYKQKVQEVNKLTEDYFSSVHQKKVNFQNQQFELRKESQKQMFKLESSFELNGGATNRKLKQKIDNLARGFESRRKEKRKNFKAEIQKQYKVFIDKIANIKREMRKKLQARDLDYSAFEK